MTDQPTFRAGRRGDARVIAELYRMAAGGVADYIWDGLRQPGDDVLDVGERRFARDGEDFSYRNATLAERDGGVIGLLHAYPMFVDPEFDPAGIDPVLRPAAELEEDASYYIAGLALRPDCRSQGVGTALMDVAEAQARDRGLEKLSLIAFEENAGSVRLYLRLGFAITDRRALVPHPMIHYGGDALLMVKRL